MRARIAAGTVVVVLALGMSGCTFPVKAPRVDRYQNIIESSQLQQSRVHINGAKTKVLAVVMSKNTQSSLAFNAELAKRFHTTLGSMTLNHEAFAADADIVMSEQGLMGSLFVPLKAAFKEVRIANSIPEAFEGGADYVGVMDMDLNYISLDSKTQPTKILHIDHIANCSINFIDQNLVAGPDVVANVTYKQETPAMFADANNRNFLFAVKKARAGLIESFTKQVNASVSP